MIEAASVDDDHRAIGRALDVRRDVGPEEPSEHAVVVVADDDRRGVVRLRGVDDQAGRLAGAHT